MPGKALTPEDPRDLQRQLQMLIASLAPCLKRHGRRLSLTSEDSADALQETLLAFLRHGGRVSEPLPWLRVVLKHECLRLFRLRKRAEENLKAYDTPTQASVVASTGLRITQQLLAQELLSSLTARPRRVLLMRFVAGMSWREIALALGCKPSGAKKAVTRALAAARDTASRQEQ